MTKREKAQKLLDKLTSLEAKKSLTVQDEITNLTNKLKDNFAVKTLKSVEKIGAQVDQFKTDFNLKPVMDAIRQLETELQQNEQNLRDELETRLLAIPQTPDLTQEVKILRSQFEAKLQGLGVEGIKADVENFKLQLQTYIESDITQDTTEKEALEKKFLALRTEINTRLSHLGGGAQNQRIQVNGATMSKKYADINFVGGMTATDNNTTKQVDLALTGTTAIGDTITGGTDGSVIFVHPSSVIAQDNSNLFFNSTTKDLSVGNNLIANAANSGAKLTLGPLPAAPTSFGGLWLAQATPDSTNYLLLGSATQSFINGPNAGDIEMRVGNVSRLQISGAGVAINGPDNTNPTIPLAIKNAAKSTTLLTLSDVGNMGILINAVYGFIGANAGLSFDGSILNFLASDGGAYFREAPGLVLINSSALQFQNAGNTKFQFSAVSTTDGQMVIVNSNGTTGVGWDIGTDATFKLRNRTFTAGTGNFDVGAKIVAYNGVATVGGGVPAIYGTGRLTAQVAAVASVATYTVGAADGSFLISANVLVTTATLHSFTATVTYTDEGNTSRTVTLQFSTIAGAFVTAMTNAQGTVPYEGVALHIRAKAATAITIATTGTFTTVAYNVEGYITQIG